MVESSQEESFRNERDAYLALRAAPTDSIVSLLGSFSHQDKHYLIIPWATHNLPSYWASRPSPQKTIANSLWLSRQLLNLAAGINHLADIQEALDTAFTEENDHFRHGDLKPANILMFSTGIDDGGESVFSAKICDLGTCKVSSKRNKFKQSQKIGRCQAFTETYRPPELDWLHGKMTPHWDVWGLGLIYLEFVCWFIRGPGGLAALTCSRKSPDHAGSRNDAYFDAEVLMRDSGFVRLKNPILDVSYCRHES
jgi:serine/threonine protein kinase